MTSLVILGGSPFVDADGRWLVAFDIGNSGRTATTVDSLGLMLGKGGGVFVFSEPAAGPNPIPKRLEPGESFNYPVEPLEILARCVERDETVKDLVPYANTGHGRFTGKWKRVALDIIERAPARDAD